MEDAPDKDVEWAGAAHALDGDPDEKEALRPGSCADRDEEGPAADDLRFARRFIKLLNLRGFCCCC